MFKIKTFYTIALLVCIIFVFTAYTGVCQSFLNLDFEYGVVKDQPRKWSIEGEGGDYFARLDSTAAISGTHSLYIIQENAEVYTFLRIPRADIAGKTIKVQGYIQFDEENSLQGKLLFNVPGSSVSFASKSADTKQKAWQAITNEASFPLDFSSDRLLVALITSGTGKFRFDHVSITIDGKPYGNSPPDFREPAKKEIEILNKKIIPATIADKGKKDLTRLKNIIKDASIVALGENSHGSSSIYKLKLSLVKTLVQKFGFTVFALEMPVAEAENINRYVQYGKGKKEDIINNLVYKSWQTQDMLDILEWIRLYNTVTERKISFQGFDIQYADLSLKNVEDFAKKNDSKLSQKLTDLRGLIDQDANKSRNWQTVYQKADSINKYLESKNISSYSSVNNDTLLKIKHNIGVYLQSLSLNYKTDSTKSRDEYMAENIDWIIKNAPPGSKIIISADNILYRDFENKYSAVPG
jgi:erythromycin esterase